MTDNETWITCRHVMNGSANYVELRPDKICLCSACRDSLDLVETDEVCVLDKERLIRSLETCSHVEGQEYLDKNDVK